LPGSANEFVPAASGLRLPCSRLDARLAKIRQDLAPGAGAKVGNALAYAENAMRGNDNDSDTEQIDHLVRELMADRPLGVKPTPAFSQLAASLPAEQRPGSRWTNIRILMPDARTPGRRNRFAFASAIGRVHLRKLTRSLIGHVHLRRLTRFFGALGPVASVRLWVGLGAVYSASLAFWPYPKTYVLGMVLYIFSLALVLVAGIWGARLSWDARLGAAHTVALGTVLWAVRLTATTLPPI
jgi:hypothetical protein